MWIERKSRQIIRAKNRENSFFCTIDRDDYRGYLGEGNFESVYRAYSIDKEGKINKKTLS